MSGAIVGGAVIGAVGSSIASGKAADASGAAVDAQVQAEREAREAQELAYRNSAPGLAQFLMPQNRQPFQNSWADPNAPKPPGYDDMTDGEKALFTQQQQLQQQQQSQGWGQYSTLGNRPQQMPYGQSQGQPQVMGGNQMLPQQTTSGSNAYDNTNGYGPSGGSASDIIQNLHGNGLFGTMNGTENELTDEEQQALYDQYQQGQSQYNSNLGSNMYDPLNQLRAASGVLGQDAQSGWYNQFQEDPGTAWLREQGQLGLNNNASAAGGLGGGSRLKAISEFNQGLANQTMGQRLNQLGSLASTDIGLAGSLANLNTGLGNAQATSLQNVGGYNAQNAVNQGNISANNINNWSNAIGTGVGAYMNRDQGA